MASLANDRYVRNFRELHMVISGKPDGWFDNPKPPTYSPEPFKKEPIEVQPNTPATIVSELEQEVVKVIKDLASEGRTMLLVTHDMQLARDLSDKVLFLHMGIVEEEGSPDVLFDSPKSTRLKQFLSAAAN